MFVSALLCSITYLTHVFIIAIYYENCIFHILMLSLEKYCIMCEGCISAVCIISDSRHVKLHQHVEVTDSLTFRRWPFSSSIICM